MARAILLAEDSPDDELLFRRVLSGNRIENPVMVVRDGAEAIAYFQGKGHFADRARHPIPAILFLDLRMPGVDGFEVLEWLNKNPDYKKSLLVVVLTQFGDAAQIRRAYELGAHSFLAKPFSKTDADNLIRHFAEHWMRPEPPAEV